MTYNSYTGIWIIPISQINIGLTVPNVIGGGTTAVTIDFTNAFGESTWSIQALTVPDYTNGGTRTVGYVIDIVFQPAYNDFQAMQTDLDAITRGIIDTVTLTLKAQSAQPKGATMEVNDNNAFYSLNDWSAFIRSSNMTEFPRLDFVLHGTFAADIFGQLDLTHIGTPFTFTEN